MTLLSPAAPCVTSGCLQHLSEGPSCAASEECHTGPPPTLFLTPDLPPLASLGSGVSCVSCGKLSLASSQMGTTL